MDVKAVSVLRRYKSPVNIAVGTALCAILATLASLLFARSSWRGLLPLAFVVVVLLLARRFGVTVSVTGSVVAAIIFALMLFDPIRSVRIHDDTARMSLGWMIVGSVALSYLFYPTSSATHRDRNRH